ncbi:MAG: helix-turn-helix transcriptional regulator [Clostridia bacterium]|nr:helix-turn-helix transcriptional regulator [Clostridia bacterium]
MSMEERAASAFERSRFFRETCTERQIADGCRIYTIRCADGVGKITRYEVFPGVELLLQDFCAHSCSENREGSDVWGVNYCLAGRFECCFDDRESVILAPGGMAVNRFDGRHGNIATAHFPLGAYRGVGLMIDGGRAGRWASERLGVLAPDFDAVRDHLLSSHWYWARQAGPQCQHVFQELYEYAPGRNIMAVRLKVLELLMLMRELPLSGEQQAYFPKNQVELVKHLRDHLVEADAQYTTVEQLAREHGISASQLQKVFKALYGMPIYAYLREYRLERAAVALLQTDRPVTEIALEAGFTNPGKFSECFRRRYGQSPSRYRAAEKNKNRNGAMESK